jgi:hypothetical protein
MNRMLRLRWPGFTLRLTLTVLAVALATPSHDVQAQAYQFEVPSTDGMRWFKGNTHTHTLESDGDSPPEYVARWYKEHGYDFLVITDHDTLTDPGALAQLVDSTFILIPGEEVTARFERKPVHVNALNIRRVVAPRAGPTLAATLQANVDAVREAGGVPQVNHPNFRWALSAEDLAAVEDAGLVEVYSGHPLVHIYGGGDSPGTEEIWDELLTRGRRIYGVAVDDAHHFQGEFGRGRAAPGRGWVVVRARSLDAAEIVRALDEGRFYASTGVELEDIAVTATRIEIRIKPRGDFKYTTTFIGGGGRVLKRTGGYVAVFELDGPTRYVRARITDSGGAMAWTQPVFVAARQEPSDLND